MGVQRNSVHCLKTPSNSWSLVLNVLRRKKDIGREGRSGHPSTSTNGKNFAPSLSPVPCIESRILGTQLPKQFRDRAGCAPHLTRVVSSN
ncbi:hypothetical protein TNCV_1163961 [Trichonephila clavipes]|nr:hypothetical protein TNCV_1163961 [Trichonephila clavipes]